MRSFDKLTGVKHKFQVGNSVLEIEVGNYCVFDKEAPSNGLHYHNCYEIAYVVKGRGYFVNNEKTTPLYKGAVFVANPSITHEIKVDTEEHSSNLELIYFLFHIHSSENENTDEFNEQLIQRFVKDHLVIYQDNGRISNFLKLIDSYPVTSTTDETMLKQVYSLMLIDMIRTLIPSNELHQISEGSKSLIDVAMIFIRENIERKFSVQEVADHAGTSTRNLQYLFRKYLDMTVIQYIHERKINLACSYLKMNISVGNVSKMIGIEEVSQFSRLFKQKMSISPKQYQKKYASAGVRFGAISQ